jgi:hypothetical protein
MRRSTVQTEDKIIDFAPVAILRELRYNALLSTDLNSESAPKPMWRFQKMSSP